MLGSFVDGQRPQTAKKAPAFLNVEEKVKSDPRAKWTVGEIVEHDGFYFERHNVMTEDGYILALHRVFLPGDINLSQTKGHKAVVFF